MLTMNKRDLIGTNRVAFERGALRFGLTIAVVTVSLMLVCIYASAIGTLVS